MWHGCPPRTQERAPQVPFILCTVNVKQRGLLENLGHTYFLFQMQCVPVNVTEVYLYQIL